MQTTEAYFQIKLYSPAGVLKCTVTDYKVLVYRNVVNTPGICTFTIDLDSEAIQYLINNAQVEVWRKVIKTASKEVIVDWTREWYGVFKDNSILFKDNHMYFSAVCIGDIALLGTREILFYSGVSGKSSFGSNKAETIMKEMVKYNATSSATTGNGRIRDGAITGVTVQTDAAGGNTIASWSCAWDNLLKSLQALAKVAGGDFNLVKTGLAAWEFRFYAGQLGTDRSAAVVFSLERGNMKDPEITQVRSTEKTVVAVLGQGEGSARRVRVATGANYSASNDVEHAYDARNETDSDAALDARGALVAKQDEESISLNFEIVQTDGSRYGLHYFLGDLTTAIFAGYTETLKITSVEVSSTSEENEKVIVKVSNV